ncbi:hypothetical protein [Polaribacter sp. 11A2H]|uniref:hypothetical protein n=1 Tax=Polaribacter sp. 11A2H TaxID=2687290 RepID=UPI00140837F4|nr:hypothetical protein [Polaribacter sp. 11A2H]
MCKKKTQGLDCNIIKQDQYKANYQKIKNYIRESKYISISERPKTCESFGLLILVDVFRKEYRTRFYNYLLQNTTTVTKVSEDLGIPNKYCTQLKRSLEKNSKLRVVFYDRCITTKSRNVQYVSTKPKEWEKYCIAASNLQKNL